MGGLGERRELPQRGLEQSPAEKQILAYCEGHRTLLSVPMTKSEGTICISVPYSKLWGDVSPRPAVIYAYGSNFNLQIYQIRRNNAK